MDDVYAINVAKTEFREAYNAGDVERLLAIFDNGLIDFSNGRCSGYGEGGKAALRSYLQDLFAKFDARMELVVVEVKVVGEMAVDYGWHELTLAPKSGGEPIRSRRRYVDVWKRNKTGDWKLAVFIDNADVPDQVSEAQPA
jgi:ketosteroid isomerase-like protein